MTSGAGSYSCLIQHLIFDRAQIAIKVIEDSSYFSFAMNEINITLGLNHPCVLNIIDASVILHTFLGPDPLRFRISSGGLALVMDLAEAGDLFGLATDPSISSALVDKSLHDMVCFLQVAIMDCT